MDMTQSGGRRSALAAGMTVAALLGAVVTTGVACGARRDRLVAWRSARIATPGGVRDARGARTYRVELPATAAGEKPLRVELMFGAASDGAVVEQVDVVLPDGGGAAPALRTARVATEMAISWPAALGAASSEVAR